MQMIMHILMVIIGLFLIVIAVKSIWELDGTNAEEHITVSLGGGLFILIGIILIAFGVK